MTGALGFSALAAYAGFGALNGYWVSIQTACHCGGFLFLCGFINSDNRDNTAMIGWRLSVTPESST